MHQSNAKEITLGILTIAAGVLNAYLWRGVLFAGEFQNAAFYSLPVLSLFAFAILFSLSSAFIRERIVRTATAVLALASGFLLVPYQPVMLSGAVLAAAGGWYGAEQIANEYSASNFFSVRKILRGGLPVFFTAVALVLAVFYLASIGGNDQAFLPKALFDAIVPLIEQPLQGILPGFRSAAAVDDLVLALAAQQLGGGLDPGTLPGAERDALLRQGRQALGEQLGIPLSGKEKATDILYEATNVQVAKFLGPYQRYLPFLAAAGFFLAIKTFTLPVYWITLILFALMIKLLVAVGFLTEKTKTVEVTRIEL